MADVLGGQIPCVDAPISDLLELHRAGAIRIVGGAGDTPCGAFCACTNADAVTKKSEARQTLRAMVRIMRGL